jgi:hypothetical protein
MAQSRLKPLDTAKQCARVCLLRKAAKHAASLLEPPCELASNGAHV